MPTIFFNDPPGPNDERNGHHAKAVSFLDNGWVRVWDDEDMVIFWPPHAIYCIDLWDEPQLFDWQYRSGNG